MVAVGVVGLVHQNGALGELNRKAQLDEITFMANWFCDNHVVVYLSLVAIDYSY